MTTVCAPAPEDKPFRCDHGNPCHTADPSEMCDRCRAEYDLWCDELASEAAFLERYETAPEGWHLEDLMAPALN